ncbi:hypothetical protein [Gynuella sunshinyii]|uniref:Uncharacterized protein n=1 Tax=Gynuella sunshinyii YC6258 TaxID=1445510 RepID=A0A0C5V4A9_9GAMM|nr:hypothetical protein [Gynuella sunshinyii]AJQ94310.1 hypothetical Protein YC6258_02272 [Gynuella sunshinyii YC6258]
MELLLALLIMITVMVIPVKLAASMVGAKNTGFFTCLGALIVASIIQLMAIRIVPALSEQLGILLSLPLTAVAYMMVLDTSFLKGILIAVLQGFILVLMTFLLAGLLVF